LVLQCLEQVYRYGQGDGATEDMHSYDTTRSLIWRIQEENMVMRLLLTSRLFMMAICVVGTNAMHARCMVWDGLLLDTLLCLE